MVTPQKNTRDIKGLSSQARQNACNYILLLVNDWITKYGTRDFSMADLLHEAGLGPDWNNTALQPIYDNRVNTRSPKPYDVAAQDAGYLLVEVLNNHSRNFMWRKGHVNVYHLI